MYRRRIEKRFCTIGRRTGLNVIAGKNIRVDSNGLENFDDYFTSSDEEKPEQSAESTPSPKCSSPAFSNAPRMSSFIRRQTPGKELPEKITNIKTPTLRSHAQEKQRLEKRKLVAKGRRTGIDIYAGKKIRVVNGIENFDDYWTDSSARTSIQGGKRSSNRISSRKNSSLGKVLSANTESEVQEPEFESPPNDELSSVPQNPVNSNAASEPLSPRGLRNLSRERSNKSPALDRNETFIKGHTPKGVLKVSTRSVISSPRNSGSVENNATLSLEERSYRGIPEKVDAANGPVEDAEEKQKTFGMKRRRTLMDDGKERAHGRSPHAEPSLSRKSLVKSFQTSTLSAKHMQKNSSNISETYQPTLVIGQGEDNDRVSETIPVDTDSAYQSSGAKLKLKDARRKNSTKKSSSSLSRSKYNRKSQNNHSKSAVESRRTSTASDMSVALGACIEMVTTDQEENDSVYETMPDDTNSGSQLLPVSRNQSRIKQREEKLKILSRDKSFNNSKRCEEGHNHLSSPHSNSALDGKSASGKDQIEFIKANGCQSSAPVSSNGEDSIGTEAVDSGSQLPMSTKEKSKKLKAIKAKQKLNLSSSRLKNNDKSCEGISDSRSGSSMPKISATKNRPISSLKANSSQPRILDFSEACEFEPNVNDPADLEVISKPKKRGRKRKIPNDGEHVDEIESGEILPRRSNRTRFPPLERWRNQRLRINYESGDIASIEVVEGSRPDNSSVDRIRKRQESRAKKNKKKPKQFKLQENSINLEKIKKDINKVEVLNPQCGEEELVYLHRPHDTLLWTVPPQQDKNDAAYTITKCFSGELISFGFIEIGVGKKKKEQHSPEYNIAFNLVKGNRIKIRIHKTSLYLKEFDYVVVPAGNVYSMHNKGKSAALLSFTTFKAPMFDYQFPKRGEDDIED